VKAICRPQSAAPANTTSGDAAQASTSSAAISSVSHVNSQVRTLTRSAAAPAG
jgi:hypothetical protein